MKLPKAIKLSLLAACLFTFHLLGINENPASQARLASIKHEARHNKQIVAYYPNWQWYRRNHLVNPETIEYEKYTVINYAFFRPMADGSIESTDTWADENLLLGPMIWYPVEMHDSTRSIVYLAAQAGVKLLPSIGGWNDSFNFPAIAADPVKRATFVQNCLNLIQTYGFNGIDLDWEYPGYAENGGTPSDTQNFVLLLQSLRTALDNLEIQSGEEYILSSCFSAAQSNMANIDWASVLPLIDMINLMTYDFFGPWDALSNHNAPLYPPAMGDQNCCLSAAFTLLTESYQVPPNKINLGLAFYGKAFANCNQLYGLHSGYDNVHFSEDAGQPHYYSILNAMSSYEYHWDDQVKCPYLLGTSFDTFISFDDTESIRNKAQYIKDHQAMGVIIWELTGDYIETFSGSGVIAGTPLLDSLIAVFNTPDDLMPPSNFVIMIGDGMFELTWDAPISFPDCTYNVYRNDILLNPVPLSATSFTDFDVNIGNTYVYYLTSVYGDSESEPSETITVTYTHSSDNVNAYNSMNLKSIYPNPLQANCSFAISVNKATEVSIDIYNVRGQLIRNISRSVLKKGDHLIQWDAKDRFDRPCGNGIYFGKISAGGTAITRKLLLIK